MCEEVLLFLAPFQIPVLTGFDVVLDLIISLIFSNSVIFNWVKSLIYIYVV